MSVITGVEAISSAPFEFTALTDSLFASLNNDSTFIHTVMPEQFVDFAKPESNELLSPFILARKAYNRERSFRKATSLPAEITSLTEDDVNRIDRRSIAVGLVLTVAGIYDGLRDNAAMLGLPTDLASLSANRAQLVDPAIARRSGRRQLDALLAEADAVGVSGSTAPGFTSVYMNAALADKPAFYHEVTQKCTQIVGVNFSNRADKIAASQELNEQFNDLDKLLALPGYLMKHQPTLDNTMLSLHSGAVLARQTAIQAEIARRRKPGELQAEMSAYALYLLSPEVLSALFPADHHVTTDPEADQPTSTRPSLEDLHPMEVNWSPLPEGELDEAAKVIIEKFVERHNKLPEIDMSRLDILRDLRQQLGPERCYFAVGELVQSYREAVRQAVETDNQPPEDVPDEYIMLVVQSRDDDGNVVREDVIADSPITQKNGLYLYRPDASDEGYGWTTIMRLEKNYARLFGARSLPHRAGKGEDLNAAMVDKALRLLTCEPGDFHAIRFGGLRGGIRRLRLVRSAAASAVKQTQRP